MTKEQAITLIRSAKDGSEMLDLLDKISALSSLPETESEFPELEFAD